MAGEQDVDPGIGEGQVGVLVPADPLGQLRLVADRHGEQGMVGDENPGLGLRHRAESLPDRPHLLVVDASILDGERACRVDAEHGQPLALEPGAQLVVDIAAVAAQGADEAAKDVVERHVVIAGHSEDRQPARLQPFDERAGLPVLRPSRPLGEIAADHHQLRPPVHQPFLQRGDDGRIVAAEMDVGQMGYGGHETPQLPE